jgi:sulfotransferase family protein
MKNKTSINKWPQFRKAVGESELLTDLDRFPSAIFVAGCQRSGTTALCRVINSSEGMARFRRRQDDELDAALILSGLEQNELPGQYCFQSTYLNERYFEYEKLAPESRLVWVVRNPHSVVYSMVYHWRRYALNYLFSGCGVEAAPREIQRKANGIGLFFIPAILKACYSYNGKNMQLQEIRRILGDDRVLVIDYEVMVAEPQRVLPSVFAFINKPYREEYANLLNSGSLNKKNKLSKKQIKCVKDICMPVYDQITSKLSLEEK